jgi:hypothetical protein
VAAWGGWRTTARSRGREKVEEKREKRMGATLPHCGAPAAACGKKKRRSGGATGGQSSAIAGGGGAQCARVSRAEGSGCDLGRGTRERGA